MQATIEELDKRESHYFTFPPKYGDANDEVLQGYLEIAIANDWVKVWALALQARQGPFGNYLYHFYLRLADSNQKLSETFLQLMTQYGIAVSLTSGHFQSLDYLDPRKMAPLNPAIARLPFERSVDNFKTAAYDLSYKPSKPGSLSELLKVSYQDGTAIDISLWDISDNLDAASSNAIVQGYVGPGGRVFPSRMSRSTVPRLWAEKQKAVNKMAEENLDFETFVSIGLAGVMSNLPMGPLMGPESPEPEALPSRARRSGLSSDRGANPESNAPVQQQPYLNNNPKATPSEIETGALLNSKAQAGELPGVSRVEGAPVGKVRSGDYRFVKPDGTKLSADLAEPKTTNTSSIVGNIYQKSGQAQAVVVKLGEGTSGQLSDAQAASIAHDVIRTPGHSIDRVIVIKNGTVVVDLSR